MEEAQQDNTATSSEAVAKETPVEEAQKKPAAPAPAAEKAVPTGETAPKKSKVDYKDMSTRPYLDATVVPILLQGLSSLARDRPADPIQFLADFLIRNKSQYAPSEDAPASAPSS